MFVTKKLEAAQKAPQMNKGRVDEDEKNVLLFRRVCNILFKSQVKKEADLTLTGLFSNSKSEEKQTNFYNSKFHLLFHCLLLVLNIKLSGSDGMKRTQNLA